MAKDAKATPSKESTDKKVDPVPTTDVPPVNDEGFNVAE